MAHRGAGCLLFASACLVAAGVAELGLRALGFETLSVRQDWTTFWDYGTYEELLAALERRGFDVLDFEALEGFDDERMRLPNDGHWNGRGHAFVAARLIEHVERHWLVGTDAE